MSDHTPLLTDLSNISGVSGFEARVARLVKAQLEASCDITSDNLGSVICRLRSSGPGPKVVLAGHMDEIGFMVKQITKEGFIKFLPLGGWFDQVLLGHRVIIKTNKGDVLGVIGAKPPHLLSTEERSKVVFRKDMYIDIGANSEDELKEAGILVGDPIVPDSDFQIMANRKSYLSKAFDDRVGVALIVSALEVLKKQTHPNTVYGTATVMEEVGLRGATTSVDSVQPDVAIILESDIAGDVPGIKEEESKIKLGGGPSMVVYDARMIPNHKLCNLISKVAKELDINLQLSSIEAGATDGGAIHLYKTGVPTVVLAIPARHIHSHNSIINRDDYDSAVKLVVELVTRLDAATVADFTM